MVSGRQALLTLMLAAAVGTALAEGEPSSGALPSDVELERMGAIIGSVEIVVEDVFDTDQPGEGWWLPRLANRLHVQTRDSVVRRQLLFREGDRYSRRLLEESERILRQDRNFFDARIAPTRVHDDIVDVSVVVRDVWTITGGVGFSRKGGENQLTVDLQDSNLLGTGKDLTVEHQRGVDRDSSLLRYRDPNLSSSRALLEAWLAENSDGYLRRLDIHRPFFALDSRWAAGLRSRFEERVDSLYVGGHVSDRFSHRVRLVELSGGLSRGLRDGVAWRFLGGLTYDEHRFEPASGHETSVLPQDRTLAYPWLGLETVEDAYLESRDLDQIVRTEDVTLGRRLSARVGWSSAALGGDRDRLVYDAAASRGFSSGGDTMALLETHASGRIAGRTENLVAGGSVRLYWRDVGRHVLFATASVDLARRLDRDNQLLLGGDNGLRGYPLRYQTGDRRFLISVEQRFFTDWHVLRLVHVGAAIFVDVGRCWFAGAPVGPDTGVLKDAGIGLRISSSRSGRGNMIHLDVAIPFDGDPSISSLQWLVSTKETF